jgi:hypothetical protein
MFYRLVNCYWIDPQFILWVCKNFWWFTTSKPAAPITTIKTQHLSLERRLMQSLEVTKKQKHFTGQKHTIGSLSNGWSLSITRHSSSLIGCFSSWLLYKLYRPSPFNFPYSMLFSVSITSVLKEIALSEFPWKVRNLPQFTLQQLPQLVNFVWLYVSLSDHDCMFVSGYLMTPFRLKKPCSVLLEPEWRIQYSDWLRAGRPRCRSSSPGGGKILLPSTLSRPVLEPTKAFYPMCTVGSFAGGKTIGAWRWLLTSNLCWGLEYVDVYIHSPIHLHDIVLN